MSVLRAAVCAKFFLVFGLDGALLNSIKSGLLVSQYWLHVVFYTESSLPHLCGVQINS